MNICEPSDTDGHMKDASLAWSSTVMAPPFGLQALPECVLGSGPETRNGLGKSPGTMLASGGMT